MLLTIVLSLVILLFVLHCYIKYRRFGRLLNQIPGPKGYPIIGNMFIFKVKPEDLIEKVLETNKKYYPIYKLWFLIYGLVVVLKLEDIEILLRSINCIEKGMVYKLLRPWLSDGLLISTGKKWHTRRKILTPSFHFKILESNIVTFNKEAECLVKSLKQEGEAKGDIVKDLVELMTKRTLNIICETALGTSLKGKEEFEYKYRDAVHNYSKLSLKRYLNPQYYSEILFAFMPGGRLQKKLVETLHGFSKNIIAERKHFHKETKGKYLYEFEEMDDNVISPRFERNVKNSIFRKELSMLDLLISISQNGNQIDDEGIREEVDTFVFEGHDTTANALIFALSLLAKHEDIQKRLRNEANTIMLQDNCKLVMSDLNKFSYLDRCIKEALRLFPSVHVIYRHMTQDIQLTKYLIPAGSMCMINIYSIHRNSEYWPNPNVFDPDRFLPENVKGRHPYAYIPFSAGPRNCIGQKYAMYELKVIITYILCNFYLEPIDNIDDVKLMPGPTLSPAHPLRVKFIPIK